MVHMKHAGDTRKPYSGLSRSLVIAIDVGTTFSGVSYAILEPGEIPKIHGVTRFPGQEHVAGNSKIPSVIYYDKHGAIMAAGAEADSSSIVAQAEDEGWIKAELFKLRLRPRQMQLNMNGMRLSPLPRGKSPVHVFGDYLAYLYSCTRSFISDTHANGAALWNSVEPDIQLVLSHPNGWEGPQQTRMRKAAVYGKLVPDTDAGRARIRFVTEGEASLHACVLSGLAGDVLSNPSKHGFLIADAGGGTLDISSYAIKGTSPLAMEEIAPPDCIFAGSVFVSRRAREFLEEKLKHSKYGSPDSLDHITRKFDETTKRLFRDRNELQFIPFGSPLDRDSAVGIRSGQLRLTGNEVANLFEPSVDAAVTCIKNQIEASHGMIRSVFLVGGYAASPWLFGQLQERLAPYKITVSRPDTQTSKAVADGAIGFYCDHHVSARMSKFMYGVEFLRELDPNDPEHLERKERLCELPSGPKLLPDAFDCILARSVKVKESTVFTRKYCTELTNLSMLSVFEVEIWCYRGGNVVPKWINRHEDEFSTLCVVQADLSLLNGSAEPKVGKNGKKYWTIVFSVEIHFGLTEFKARIKWMDNGQVKYGPAVIVYNERGSRMDDDDVDLYPEDDASSMNTGRDRDRQRSSPASRSRSSVEPHYPPPSGSRRTSAAGSPETPRMERTSSKGYSPSVAPSVSRSTHSTSRNDPGKARDSDRYGSDSDRSKGKDRSREMTPGDRERGFGPSSGAATPIDRARSVSTTYGTPAVAMAKVPSMNSNDGVQGEFLSSTWVPPAASAPSRPPSVKPQSRSPSIYGTSGAGAGHTSPQDFSAPPLSAVSDSRQSRLWDAPAAEDRPKSPFVDKPYSPTTAAPAEPAYSRPPSAYGRPASTFDNDASYKRPVSIFDDPVQSRPRSPYAPSFADRPKSPFVHGSPSAAARSGSPFIDRPKSGIEGSFFGDRPKSAFGDAPALFGDAGPAADVGHVTGTSLFGDPPASVFGEAAGDSWGVPTAAAAASPAPSMKSSKSKRKSSAAATPVVPASGIASRASPALSAHRSPLAQEVGAFDNPAPALSPALSSGGGGGGGGLWGSKAPSPAHDKDRGLSPLNPTQQIHDDAAGGLWGSKAPSPMDKDRALSPLNPAAQVLGDHGTPKDDWGFDAPASATPVDAWGNGGGGHGGDTWGSGGGAHSPAPAEVKVPSRVPSRAPSPVPVTPVVETPVEEAPKEMTTAGSKKKKKKAGAAAAKDDKEEERKKAEAEKAEKERLAAEAAAAEKAEKERKQAEEERLAAEKAEEDRKIAAAAAAEEERKRKEEEEEKEREKERKRVDEENARKAEEKAKAEAERIAEEQRIAEAARVEAEKQEAEAKKAREAEEKAEHERKEAARKAEEEERLKKEQAALEAQQAADEAKHRKEQEEKEAKEKEEREAKEKEEKEKEKEKAAEPASVFGNATSLFSDTGGGDDTWGSSWGAPVVTTGKKKKGKNATPVSATTPPSAFGFGNTTWGSFGGGLSEDTPKADPVPSPKPSPKPAPADLPSTALSLDFGASNLGFSFGGEAAKPPSRAPSRAASRAPSPAPAPAEPAADATADMMDDLMNPGGDAEEDNMFSQPAAKGKKKKGKKGAAAAEEPTPAASPPPEPEQAADPGDAADPLADLLGADGNGEDAPEDDGFGAASGKKKKKKKGGAADVEATPATPVEETPAAEPAGGGGAKKKKKKK